ncbi:MAG: YlbF family regulator [Clostridia bacterium]|nr:YlbF family regulator [Clostridia bacterium]MBQ7751779.1 YlbF family regulator [Clostridia bacterium]
MTIIEKAHELGKMIEASEEMKALKEAERIQAEDDEAQQLVADFNIKRMDLARKIQGGKITEEEAIKKNNEAFSEMVEKSESIKNYVAAKENFDRMVNGINDVINIYIVGKQEGCTHNCSTCGGCH